MPSSNFEMNGADVEAPLPPEEPKAANSEIADRSEQEIEDGTKSLLNAESRINELVSELQLIEKAIKSGEVVGISSQTLSDKQEGIIGEIRTLEDEKATWLQENGKEKLPEGISVAEGEDGWAVKLNTNHEQEEKMLPEERRKFINKWKERAVKDFTRLVQEDWRSKDAVNVPMVLDVIKNNVPLAIERKSKKFLDGDSEFLPDFVVIRWKTNSLFDSLTGKPNQIRELKIDFAGESETLAEESELIEKDEKGELPEEAELKRAA